MVPPCPRRGVYVPAVAFFKEDETLDLEAMTAHLSRTAKAGVDGLVIQGSNGEAMHKSALHAFFDDVASASPVPILLYNFPAVTAGINLDSDLIAGLAAANDKVVGCKLTCGNMGKLQRIAHDARIGHPFAAFAGKTDFFLHGFVGGSHGVIAATANLVPKTHLHMLELYDEGKLAEAQALQTRFSRADWALVQLGVAGLKAALDKYYGYGAGRSRRPLATTDRSKLEGEAHVVLQDLVELERSLPGC